MEEKSQSSRPARSPGEPFFLWLPRLAAWWLLRRPGSPFEMLAERGHPLVRAEMRRTRRKRRIATAIYAGVPPAIFAVNEGGLTLFGFSKDFEPGLAGLFICFWPAVLFAGAALSAAGAVNEEIVRETALQLTLTPIPARPLAAAKILPRVRPYLWGVLAALPLYVWTGGSEIFSPRWAVPLPLAFWPIRMLAALPGRFGLGLSAAGAFIGALMCLADLALVWAAAMWGAAYAIRDRGLVKVVLRLVGRVFLLGLVIALSMVAASIVGVVPLAIAAAVGVGSDALLAAIGLSFGLACFAALWWLFLLVSPSAAALGAFQAFDRLANPEFEVYIIARREQSRWAVSWDAPRRIGGPPPQGGAGQAG